ncbi:hypothetical protein, partial [Pseudomonas sp. RW409]
LLQKHISASVGARLARDDALSATKSLKTETQHHSSSQKSYKYPYLSNT